MTNDDEEINVLRFHEYPPRKSFILKPKPDITPMEVLDIIVHLIASMNIGHDHLMDNEVTVHLSEDCLAKFDANTLRHFEIEP